MHPYLRAAIAAGVLLSAVSSAAVTGEWQVNLKKGSTNQAPAATGKTLDEAVAACQARIPASASAKATYQCHNLRYVAVVTSDPVPPLPPPPPEECPPLASPTTRTQTCPDGKIGSWQQTLTQSNPPACTTAWLPVDPPAGACTDPPPPPPSGDTIRHSQPFTVTGANFGSKQTAAPLVFDDFESGTGVIGGKAAAFGKWSSGDWSSGVTYGTHDGHKIARHQFAGGTYNASLYVHPSPASSTIYASFWLKAVPRATASGSDYGHSRNWKAWRFYAADRSSDIGNNVFYCDLQGGVDLGGAWTYLPGFPHPGALNTWMHYEILQAPGLVRHYRNGKIDLSSGNQSPPAVGEIVIGHYWGLDRETGCARNAGADIYTDDIYVDRSLARVILADAPSMATAKLFALQVARSWADGSVTVTGNTRGFKAGDTAYVIVIDAKNVERRSVTVIVQ